jgi:hypothetical protein
VSMPTRARALYSQASPACVGFRGVSASGRHVRLPASCNALRNVRGISPWPPQREDRRFPPPEPSIAP